MKRRPKKKIPKGSRLCPQCWRPRKLAAFKAKRGDGYVRWCMTCRERYGNWSAKTPAEKAAVPRIGVPVTLDLRAVLFLDSKNRKLGGIPCSITSRGTCPPSCGFFEAGCYAEFHVLAHHWREVGRAGDEWADFIDSVKALPDGTLWRHNVAGDLPGDGDGIHVVWLDDLVLANKGKRGFTFTHKPVRPSVSPMAIYNAAAIKLANESGFTVNLSADSLEDADALAALGIAPVAVVLPSDAPTKLRTPAGRHVVVCPAEWAKDVTCATCGLCAKPQRKAIIGFRAHGQAAARVSELVQIRRKDTAA